VRRTCLLVGIGLALVVPPAGASHVVAQPAFLSTGGAGAIGLVGPNEREEPMTSFSATVPDGIRIVRAQPVPGWEARVEGSVATWNRGALAPNAEGRFELELDVSAEPGTVEIEATQAYPGGETVTWPVRLTILPAASSSSRDLRWALVAAVAGLLVLGAGGALAWRRHASSLQER